jgi:hypothetical protein
MAQVKRGAGEGRGRWRGKKIIVFIVAGPRIKTDPGATGSIKGIVYDNILEKNNLYNIFIYLTLSISHFHWRKDWRLVVERGWKGREGERVGGIITKHKKTEKKTLM